MEILLTPPLFLDNYNAERIKLIEYDQKYPKDKNKKKRKKLLRIEDNCLKATSDYQTEESARMPLKKIVLLKDITKKNPFQIILIIEEFKQSSIIMSVIIVI